MAQSPVDPNNKVGPLERRIGEPNRVVSPPAPAKKTVAKNTNTELEVSRNEYEALKGYLEQANAALQGFAPGIGGAATSVNFDGNVYNIDQMRKEVDRIKKEHDVAKKRFDAANKVVGGVQDRLTKITSKIDDAVENNKINKGAGVAPAMSEAELTKLRQEQAAIKKELDGVKNIPAGQKVVATTAKTTPKTAVAPVKKADPAVVAPALAANKTITPEAAAIKKPAVVTGGGGAGGRTTTGGGTGAKGGGSGTVTPPKPGKPVKPGAKKPTTDWSTIVQQEFGPLWDVYNTNPDVKKVLDDAVAGGYQNDEVQMAEKLRSTSWFQTTERSARQFAIRQSTDPAQVDDEINIKVEDFRATALANGFTFDDATLRKLATDSTKYGWSATQTQNAVGSEAVAQAQGRGAQGMKDLRSGTLGQNLRKIAAGYAQKPSEATFDQFVIEIMNGTKTETQFTDAMRESAKSQFRSLQPGLDKGSDVDTLLAGYKQQAAQVLGTAVDTSQIDWTSDKWNKALNYRDEKTNEFRQMDLWEWNKYLRTLPEWQNTDDAKRTYQNVAYSLAQGFGRMPQ
jgi:hypothetical protein